MVVFHLTIFLSAFLLFLVQPMEGNLLLPLFGGAPSVWVVTIVFYQVILFLGYVVAHLVSSCCNRFVHLVIHVGFLFGATIALRLMPENPGSDRLVNSPVETLLSLLTLHVGLPFFILSMTSPLVQRWLAWVNQEAKVYKLYATSNIGSLAALFVYPIIFEPLLPLSSQVNWWSALFVLWALCCSWCVLVVWRGLARNGYSGSFAEQARLKADPIDKRQLWFWLALSACSSMFLTAITNLMCNQLSSLPFVFLLPLGVYLLTFIVAFSAEGFRLSLRGGLIAIAAVVLVFALLAIRSSLFVQTAFVYAALLGAVCLFCHVTLYRSRPVAEHLTAFYVALSAGGAVGSLLVAIVAPVVFTRYYELPLSFVVFGVLLTFFMFSNLRYQNRTRVERAVIIALSAIFVILIPLVTLSMAKPPGEKVVFEARNFFGKISVSISDSGNPEKEMMVAHHGMTIHGAQRLRWDAKLQPITYYGEGSGIWAAFHALDTKPALRVGAVGLATGCIVGFRGTGDLFRFYEINQTAIDIAKEHFTFLRDTPAKSETVLGDARLQLEQEESQQYDLIVLDAFIGGAIPVHLLTAEMFPTYLRHLRDGGVIAVHVSNHFLDLRPVVAALAEKFNLSFVTVDSATKDEFLTPSRWMVLARDPAVLQREPFQQLRKSQSLDDGFNGRRLLWTDDFHNLLSIIVW